MQPTVEKIVLMIQYLGNSSFVVPHHHLPLPEEADGENYRSEKVFRFLLNGKLFYQGWGSAPHLGRKFDISIGNITPTQRWIDRAYIYIIGEVRSKVKIAAGKSGLPVRKAGRLILKFNHLDFVDIDEVF